MVASCQPEPASLSDVMNPLQVSCLREGYMEAVTDLRTRGPVSVTT